MTRLAEGGRAAAWLETPEGYAWARRTFQPEKHLCGPGAGGVFGELKPLSPCSICLTPAWSDLEEDVNLP